MSNELQELKELTQKAKTEINFLLNSSLVDDKVFKILLNACQRENNFLCHGLKKGMPSKSDIDYVYETCYNFMSFARSISCSLGEPIMMETHEAKIWKGADNLSDYATRVYFVFDKFYDFKNN